MGRRLRRLQRLSINAAVLGEILFCLAARAAQDGDQSRLVGDLGAGVYHTGALVRGTADSSVLPYAYFDYGRFFARVDTFGVRTLPLGHGTLELVARVSQEGFLAQHAGVAAAQRRSNPVPVGLGSFQETPLGGFFVYGFADLASGGALAEATYAAEFKLARLTVYPTAGLEWRSQRYVRHLYGIPASEAGAAAALPYAPGASLAPNLGMALEVPLGGSWFINGQWRRRWFDSAVSASPLVQQATQDSAFIALSYRFK